MTFIIFVLVNMTYNVFMEMIITIPQIAEPIANTLQVLGSPARIAILIAIGRGEACVCHLEAILGWRQSYISQHLMALRKAEILQDRRAGRYVYYQLKNQALLALIQDAAVLSGLDPKLVERLANPMPDGTCECPYCAPTLILPEQIKTGRQ